MHLRRPGRLPNVSYVGIQRYFLTLCTAERKTWFTNPAIVEPVLSQLLQFASDHRFAIPAYVFMPDHLHLLAEGTSLTSNLERFVGTFKQRTGFWFSREHKVRLWQDGYYDRILRNDEATLTVVRYILENPVRAKFADSILTYPYLGSDQYALADLVDAVSQG